jgi:uncharacterized protein (UPF0335 family)
MKELRNYADRLLALENQREEIASDIADLKKEAEDHGLDKKLLADTVRIMRMEKEKQQAKLHQLELFDTYLAAVGIVPAQREAA